MTNNQDALKCADELEQLPITASFDGTLFARTGSDNLDSAAAHIRRLVAENEAKDALLRQAVEALEPMLSAQLADGTYADKDCKITFAIAAIRQHLGQKGETQ